MPESGYNTDTDGDYRSNVDDFKEVGANCTLSVAGGTTVPVENVSFSEEANTSEVQYTGSFTQSIAVTGVTYSGSFDIPGNANSIRDDGWDNGSDNSDNTTLPQEAGNLSITDSQGRTYTFENVLFNSHSKDIPSDDRTSQSFDFMAEKLTVTGGA